VREVIRALKARGTTVFLNSHLLTEVEQVCDRVAIVDQGRVIQVGALDDLLRADAVRVRATGIENGGLDAMRAFGELQHEGDWIVVRGIGAERVPDLVRAIVERGGRVYAVEPRHESLEDRFLSLLEKPKA
jgi:ABC-2 type transport system ATP-binding protein